MKMASRIYVRRCVLVLMLSSLSVILISCESWPPMKEELVENFFLHRECIEQLVEEFSDSMFLGIRHGSAAADIYASSDSDNAQRPLSSELGERFRQHLEKANVYSIIRLGDRMIIIPYFDNFRSGSIISAQYVFENGFRGDPSCDEFTNRSQEVECYIQLDVNWALMYNRIGRE